MLNDLHLEVCGSMNPLLKFNAVNHALILKRNKMTTFLSKVTILPRYTPLRRVKSYTKLTQCYLRFMELLMGWKSITPKKLKNLRYRILHLLSLILIYNELLKSFNSLHNTN